MGFMHSGWSIELCSGTWPRSRTPGWTGCAHSARSGGPSHFAVSVGPSASTRSYPTLSQGSPVAKIGRRMTCQWRAHYGYQPPFETAWGRSLDVCRTADRSGDAIPECSRSMQSR
jgi:hypothetical protein